MHSLERHSVRYKSLDAQASIGLQKCINVLLGMEVSVCLTTRSVYPTYMAPITANLDDRTPRPTPHPERQSAYR